MPLSPQHSQDLGPSAWPLQCGLGSPSSTSLTPASYLPALHPTLWPQPIVPLPAAVTPKLCAPLPACPLQAICYRITLRICVTQGPVPPGALWASPGPEAPTWSGPRPSPQQGHQTAGPRSTLPRAELSLQNPRPPAWTRRGEGFNFLYKQGNLPERSVSGFGLMQSWVSQHLCYTLGAYHAAGGLPWSFLVEPTLLWLAQMCPPSSSSAIPVTVTFPISAVRLLASGQQGCTSSSSLLPTDKAARISEQKCLTMPEPYFY